MSISRRMAVRDEQAVQISERYRFLQKWATCA
jgi:hypothetical protein